VVIPERLEPETRGQILLVGAVAIAFIIIGLVIVFNTVLFTENVGSSESLQSTDAGGTTNEQIRTGLAALTYRLNDDGLSGSEFNDSVRSNVTKYSNILGESQAESSGAVINVSFNQSRTGYGSAVAHGDRADEFETGPLVDSSDQRDIGGFVLTLNVSSLNTTGTDTFEIQLTSGATLRTVEFVNNSSDVDVVVNSTRECTIPENQYSGDNVTLALSKGSAPNAPGCSYNFTHGLNPGYGVSMANTADAKGTYFFAVNGTRDGSWEGTVLNDPTIDSVEVRPAVWRLAVDVTYETQSTRYANRQSVFVYNTTR